MNNGQTEAAAANHATVMAALNLRETIADEQSLVGQYDYDDTPYDHRILVGEMREEWPALWEAIDRLVATTKGYRT